MTSKRSFKGNYEGSFKGTSKGSFNGNKKGCFSGTFRDGAAKRHSCAERLNASKSRL